jgi:uncharacterized protein involved in response to NO
VPPADVPQWRREPFRVFFPLGVVLGWVGVGHWVLYASGLTATYSCLAHGLVQTEAFLMAFAAGFLLTAVPRRTATPPPAGIEMAAIAIGLAATTAAAMAERWAAAELAYAGVLALLLRFGAARFAGRAAGRRPPACLVLVPIGALAGLAGALSIAASTLRAVPAWTMDLGRLLTEQGVFLCFMLGAGGLVLPLVAGRRPPADLDASPAEAWRAWAWAAAGLAVLASLGLDLAGFERAGPLVRAGVTAAGLAAAGGFRRRWPPGLHRRLVRLAVWLAPLGLAAAGLRPDYRVPALHVLFIGGFALLAFGVATHVVLGHLDLWELARGSPPAVRILGAALLLAMLGRLTADWSHTYFAHVGWSAAVWLAGTAVWLGFVLRLFRRG